MMRVSVHAHVLVCVDVLRACVDAFIRRAYVPIFFTLDFWSVSARYINKVFVIIIARDISGVLASSTNIKPLSSRGA